MNAFISAFTTAAQMLGAVRLTTLTPGQLAQLRAIDRNYQQRVYTLRHAVGGDADLPGAPAERELTAAEVEELRATIAAAIVEMLTPEQRSAVGRR